MKNLRFILILPMLSFLQILHATTTHSNAPKAQTNTPVVLYQAPSETENNLPPPTSHSTKNLDSNQTTAQTGTVPITNEAPTAKTSVSTRTSTNPTTLKTPDQNPVSEATNALQLVTPEPAVNNNVSNPLNNPVEISKKAAAAALPNETITPNVAPLPTTTPQPQNSPNPSPLNVPTKAPNLAPIQNEQLAELDSSNPMPKLQSLNEQPTFQESNTTSLSHHSISVPINPVTITPAQSNVLSREKLSTPAVLPVQNTHPLQSEIALPVTALPDTTIHGTVTQANAHQYSHINSQAVSQLSTNVLNLNEISQGADETQNSYVACLTQIHSQMKSSVPQFSSDTLITLVADKCAPVEDLFSIYNILLAASKENKMLSETQAANFLEKSYQNYGREGSNRQTRVKVLQLLGFIEKDLH